MSCAIQQYKHPTLRLIDDCVLCQVILLDYGEARKVHPQQDNDTLQRGKNGTPALVNELVGTTTFASINSHHGLPLSYKDDLQSLAYVQ